MLGFCGASSGFTMTSTVGFLATGACLGRLSLAAGRTHATVPGRTWSVATLSACPTSGNMYAPATLLSSGLAMQRQLRTDLCVCVFLFDAQPWFASWDLAFHCVAFAPIDVSFAKRQLILILRDWYMHPNGQIPAYEWSFSDVNPPVHAMAVMKVYEIEKRQRGTGDLNWLEACLHKLIINFAWWVNRKDESGNNVFGGGFLGLDNVGVFDRSQPLPGGGSLQQSDGTSWMAMYCLNMMSIALELARCDRKAYADTASKFYEHFLYIAKSMSDANDGHGLWDDTDGFFYDVMSLRGKKMPLKVRSMVGLIPLFAVEVYQATVSHAGHVHPAFDPVFARRIKWFEDHRPDLAGLVSNWTDEAKPEVEQKLVSLCRGSRIKKVLAKMLDPEEFLSDYGIRSLSKFHKDNPFNLHLDGIEYRVDYAPAESLSGLFGGNSNWRGAPPDCLPPSH